MKKIFIILVFSMLLLNVNLIFAEENHQSEIEEGKKLTESRISCDKLSDEQLETIGDYYMEQMHPGGAHEAMDSMMGGEDSENLKQMHIQMAKKFYCRETNQSMMGNNMMDGGMMSNGMMAGGGMMGNNMRGFGMMKNNQVDYNHNILWNALWFISLIGIIVLIIWVAYAFTIGGTNNHGKR